MAQSSNGSSSSNNLVIPRANAALEQLKYEVAQELGITLSPDGYQGNKTSYENGSIGGYITKRLVTLAEQQLAGQFQ
ncbi:alpha/beta-type small acid-soluble spore protein [Paenibacillus rhizophilus]|uniref:Alpha/beta-type small acid-soluble spore protein n=1 Tax=Paenibacillus rhizophilus TaxID=1850366 RepID=A0A3N9P8I1_9BACL|nr:alpha/beta-type small acid-soluble spore protein [Paenibacillus rhizophilus]RQW12573.1 alpha/beta-type small acid-soluble spore protein [Paenibacillus rhizophilus]